MTIPRRFLCATVLPRRRAGGFALALAALLFVPLTAHAASHKKGSFPKSTTTAGCPGACQNVVPHGLGETPKALILWTNAKTNEAISPSFLFGFGISDGPGSSRSVTVASVDGAGNANTSRRMTTAALTVGDFTHTNAVLAQATLVSWDATSFTVQWSPNNATAYVVHFIAIGGGDVSAKVIDWQMPAATGIYYNNTIGFKPDVVLHAHAGDSYTVALGTGAQNSEFGLGVMAAAGDQWANVHASRDAAGNADTQRGQQTDACIYAVENTAASPPHTVTKEAQFSSMEADGFRVDFVTANGNQGRVISLALKGVSARAGNFAKTTAAATASQVVADVGFRPNLVLLTSFQDVAQANPGLHARFGIGASDGTNEGSSALVDTDGPTAMSVDGIDKTSKAFVKLDVDIPATWQAEADLTSFFNGGFNLSWTTNDAVATQILYLALGQQSEAKVLSGSYTGDGTDNRAINVGFVPDFVIVKGNTTQVAVFRTSTMTDGRSKEADNCPACGFDFDWIQSIDSAGGGGFTVGTNARVNSNGVMYYWTAFKSGPGKMEVGSYTGDGTAPDPTGGPITSSFSPEVVFVISEGTAAGHEAIHRSSAPNATGGFTFFDSGAIAGTVTLGASGFTLGTDSHVNAAGTVYHWVAWNELAGYMDVGNYTGDAQNPRNITGVGFEPEVVIQKRVDNGGHTHQRPASLAASTQDLTLEFTNVTSLCCRITQLQSDGFQLNNQWNTNTAGPPAGEYFYYAWKRESQPFVISGDYTGTPAAQSITDIGFAPDVVIVKGNTTQNAVIRTSTMTGANSKPMVGATGLTANLITSLDGGGFTVGTDARVNSNTIAYYWIAFKAAAGTMKVGTYNGNGLAGGQTITGVGFSPELVFIMSESTGVAIHRSSATTGAPAGSTNEAYDFLTGGGDATWVSSLNADGFTLGSNHVNVNAASTVYHYVAWNEIPGHMDVGSYTGDGLDNRNYGLVGFEPEYVLIKSSDAGIFGTHHPASLGRSVDTAMWFDAQANTVPGNRIQALQPDGFQLGNQVVVNGTAGTAFYSYYAWRRPYVSALTAVRLTAFDATRYDRGVLLQWRTGYEIDNLGFHVYREVNGERTRVTRSLVAGSGLMAGQGAAVTAEQRYAYWDLAAADRSAVYWLEDVDFDGTSTWHGPVTPVEGRLQAPPDVASSEALNDLSKRWKRRGKLFLAQGARLERLRKHGPRPAASPLQSQWALAAQAAVKIGVDRPGWYRVSQPELVAAGLDPRVDPRTLRLFIEGVEQAIAVTGEADGRFDSGDAIEFYGTGADTPYAETRVYWLTAGSRQGRRIPVHGSGRPGARAMTAGTFAFTLQQKERSIYFAALRNGDDENWFGSLVSEEPTEIALNVSNVDPGGAADLEVTLQGVTSTPDVDPDHQAAVLVNGVEVGELRFDGQAKGVQTLAVPAGILREGANTVTMVARGGESDYSLVDLIRLRYAHTYRADADMLRFTAEGPGTVTVAGFASSAIRVADITDPLGAEEVDTRGAIAQDGGLWTVTVRVPASGPRTLLAFTDATVAAPASVRANRPSRWHAAANTADYIAVSHAEFADWIAPLAARREQQGHTTARIDVEDLYDEFSFGEKTPEALKDFLTHARTNWKRPPRFLLLVGDATIDPRDYAGFGDADFVPTKQVPMAQIALETASDDWFGDTNDDGLTEVAVGRLSVRTGPQAERMVAKILDYENSVDAFWSRDILLIADQNDESSDFEQSTGTLRSLVPSGYAVHQVLSGASGPDAARLELTDAVNQGQLIVNYTGHGSVRVWGKEGTLLTSEVVTDAWRNAARLPLVVAMNCLNGFFHGIYDEESLAETLLRAPDGGAVAAWASSGVTESAMQARVNQEFFRLIFAQPGLTVGEAVAAAKRAVSDRDVRRSWVFFGDPALRLLRVRDRAETDTVSDEAAPAAGGQSDTDSDAAADESSAMEQAAAQPVRLADFNADGRDDVLLYEAETGRWTLVMNGRGGRRATEGAWLARAQVLPAALDADRFLDLFLYAPATGEWMQALNNGDGTFRTASGVWAAGWQVRIANFTGDARDEVLFYQPLTGDWFESVSDGKGGFTFHGGHARAGSELSVADFNRDSLADLFITDRAAGNGWVAVNDGIGGFSVDSDQWSYNWPARAANLGGRKATVDLLMYDPRSGVWAERLARANQSAFRSGAWSPDLAIAAADLSGDGADDLLLYDPGTGGWSVLTNTSSGLLASQSGAWRPGLSIATGDLDGDGRADVLLHDRGDRTWSRCSGATSTTLICGESGAWDRPWSLVGYRR